MYAIGEFANLCGVTTQTLRNWDKNGKLKAIKISSNHRRYTDDDLLKVKGMQKTTRKNVIYCRESTKQQHESLIKQESKCKEFAFNKGITIDEVLSEYGSGLNYKRKKLNKLIEMITSKEIDNLIVYYKDRLVRFGFELISQLCFQFDTHLIVIDDSETDKTKEQEFAEDLISIIHYFSMRLYGSRSYKKKVQYAEQNILDMKEDIKNAK